MHATDLATPGQDALELTYQVRSSNDDHNGTLILIIYGRSAPFDLIGNFNTAQGSYTFTATLGASGEVLHLVRPPALDVTTFGGAVPGSFTEAALNDFRPQRLNSFVPSLYELDPPGDRSTPLVRAILPVGVTTDLMTNTPWREVSWLADKTFTGRITCPKDCQGSTPTLADGFQIRGIQRDGTSLPELLRIQDPWGTFIEWQLVESKGPAVQFETPQGFGPLRPPALCGYAPCEANLPPRLSVALPVQMATSHPAFIEYLAAAQEPVRPFELHLTRLLLPGGQYLYSYYVAFIDQAYEVIGFSLTAVGTEELPGLPIVRDVAAFDLAGGIPADQLALRPYGSITLDEALAVASNNTIQNARAYAVRFEMPWQEPELTWAYSLEVALDGEPSRAVVSLVDGHLWGLATNPR